MIEFDNITRRNLRQESRGRRADPDHRAGRAVRPAGAQRGRQDDDDQDAGRAAAADGRVRRASAATTWPTRRARRPPCSATCPTSRSSTTSCPAASSSSSSPRCADSTDRPVRQRIERETENFGLAEFLDDLTETYSHGMKQRLVFASALLHDPAVLVIDEPMVGLDPRSVRLVKDLLRRAAAGTAVFMSTHTLAVAEEIADRIGIVDHGRLHFLGTVAQLREELASDQASLERLFLELTDESNGQAAEATLQPDPQR